jgi:hypothetical protein
MIKMSFRIALNDENKFSIKATKQFQDEILEIDQNTIRDLFPSIRKKDIIKSLTISLDTSNRVVTLVFINFKNLTINPYTNSIPNINYLKLYNIEENFSIFRCTIDHSDIENSNGMFLESNFKKIRINEEQLSQEQQTNKKYNQSTISFNDCNGKEIELNDSIEEIKLINSNIDKLQTSTLSNILTKLCILDRSLIESLSIRTNINTLKSHNSTIFSILLSGNTISNLEIENSNIGKITGYSLERILNKENTDFSSIIPALSTIADKVEYFNTIEQNYDNYYNTIRKKPILKGILKYFMGYGIRPFRILLTGAFFITIFSLIYGLLIFYRIDNFQFPECPDLTYFISQCAFFSVSIYTSLGFNVVYPENYIGRIFVSIETLIGILMNSLLLTSIYRRLF